MKTALVIQDDLLFLPIGLKRFLSYKNNLDLVIILKEKNYSIFKKIKQNLLLMGIRDFFLISFLFLNIKFSSLLSRFSNNFPARTLESICKENKIRFEYIDDINSKSSIKILPKNLDLLLSLSAPQIFSDELLSKPRLGTINLHGSYLPDNRGMLPSFWYLYNDSKMAGTTVHIIDSKIDAGNILSQVKFPISKIETQYSLIRKSKRIGIYLLSQVYKNINKTKKITKYKSNDINKGNYNSWPTESQSKIFRNNYKRFITLRQVIRSL